MVRKPLETFEENLEEVKNLLAIHKITTGEKPGRRHSGFTTLNKSGVVLLVACWEAFVEDLADKTFSALLRKARGPKNFPKKVQKLIVKSLTKEGESELKVLELAEGGWKKIFNSYRSETTAKLIKGVNTPSAENIDNLFSELIGIDNLSKCWSWRKTTPASARNRLSKLIKLRGDIAHRVKSKSEKTVRKDIVEEYLEFIKRIAMLSNNRVDLYLRNLKKNI